MSLAVCFAVFVLLVNLFPTVAYACGGVPGLGELAKAVAWSPSLSAAMDNEYVQPIGQSQTGNGVTVTMEYAIADQKRANIYYTVKSGLDTELGVDPEVTDPNGESVSYGSTSSVVEDSGLRELTVDFKEEDDYSGVRLTLHIHDNGPAWPDDVPPRRKAPTRTISSRRHVGTRTIWRSSDST